MRNLPSPVLLLCGVALLAQPATALAKINIGESIEWVGADSDKAEEQYGAKRVTIDIGKHKGFILEPATPPAEGARPWVWYAPTIGSHPNHSNEWVLRRLLD